MGLDGYRMEDTGLQVCLSYYCQLCNSLYIYFILLLLLSASSSLYTSSRVHQVVVEVIYLFGVLLLGGY